MRRRFVVVLLLAMVAVGVIGQPVALASAREAALASVKAGVYITQSPQFFDVNASTIPVTALVANFSTAPVTVTRVEVRIGSLVKEETGTWRAVQVGEACQSKEQFDESWAIIQRPGVKGPDSHAKVDALFSLLEETKGRYDAIKFNLSAPEGVSPGDTFEYTLTAELSTGQTVSTAGTLNAQSLTVPSGWLLGDAHIHSTWSDGQLSPAEIKTRAQSLGHEFTYLTDHIDLILAGAVWTTYYDAIASESTSTYTMLPGLEATAKDADGDGDMDGDALGFGLPRDNNAIWAIDNQQETCAELINTIQSTGPYASAYVAHPDSILGPSWDDTGCGYDGVQIIDFGMTTWESSMIDYATTCRAAALGGTDLHYSFQSMGKGTWVYAPAWAGTTDWSSRHTYIAQSFLNGTTTATKDGSFAYFTIDDHYPGAEYSIASGTRASIDVFIAALDNGYAVQITWDLYRNSTWINGTTTNVLPSGSSPSWENLSETIQNGVSSYYLKVRYDYKYSDGTTAFTSYAYCGPIYTNR